MQSVILEATHPHNCNWKTKKDHFLVISMVAMRVTKHNDVFFFFSFLKLCFLGCGGFKNVIVFYETLLSSTGILCFLNVFGEISCFDHQGHRMFTLIKKQQSRTC